MHSIDFLTTQCVRGALVTVVLATLTTASRASEIEGFTEPYRNINVAASEMGLLVTLDVREGDRVTAGQMLARLDQTVLNRTLEIARAAMDSSGRLEAAKADKRMHQESLEQLQQLRSRGHASQRELDRAQAQTDIAVARLKEAQEDLAVRALEYARARAQLQERCVVAPIDGIVTQVYKEPSEFVSPNDPNVVKIVQLDPLLIVFSVPIAEAKDLARAQTVQVRRGERSIQGTVEFVSPMADAQSGTVHVRVRIPNPGESIPGGVSCHLVLPDDAARHNKAHASR